MPVKSEADIEHVMAGLETEPVGGAIVLPDAFAISHRNLIVALAARHRVPVVYPYRFFGEIGGLLSYGVDSEELFRQAAGYIAGSQRRQTRRPAGSGADQICSGR